MSISAAAERAEACCYLNAAVIIAGLRAPTRAKIWSLAAEHRRGSSRLSGKTSLIYTATVTGL